MSPAVDDVTSIGRATPGNSVDLRVASLRPSPGGRARVLHVVDSLDKGAVENWLLRMLEYGRRRGQELRWSFYCIWGAGAQDDRARQLGAEVISSPVPVGRKARFMQALRAELRRGGYDVLHCHHDLISGVYLAASLGIGLRRRIVHVHNADENLLTPSRLKQRLFREPLRRSCLTLADRIVGISNHTLDTFLAGRPRRRMRDVVHYYGLDPAAFSGPAPDRIGFRRQLEFSPESRILLFAGRMVPEKNPVFAVEVLAEMRRRDPAVSGVFVGEGSLDEAVRHRVAELGIGSGFRHLGWRGDIAQIMRCADWFILPRPEQPMEGFGLAVLEAQLAGLRLILSRGIPDDPLLPTASAARLPLASGPADWAEAALALGRGAHPPHAEVLAAFSQSPFAMDAALYDLLCLYE